MIDVCVLIGLWANHFTYCSLGLGITLLVIYGFHYKVFVTGGNRYNMKLEQTRQQYIIAEVFFN